MVSQDPGAYRDVIDESRRILSAALERRNVQRTRKVYERAIRDIEIKLAKLAPNRRETFTGVQYRNYLAQLRIGLQDMVKKFYSATLDVSGDSQEIGLKKLIADLHKLENYFTGADVILPIEQALTFQGILDETKRSMLRSQQQSIARYGAELVGKMENALTQSLLTGVDLGTVIDNVHNIAEGEWWQAERIVRTETAWAYNSAQARALSATSKDIPDLMMRWNEHISNSGVALDNRVDGGRIGDSHAMHGQVAPAGGLFKFPNTMRDGGPIPASLSRFRGQSWANPPNRPNDRAVLSPWRPHWGIPGWKWVAGNRIDV